MNKVLAKRVAAISLLALLPVYAGLSQACYAGGNSTASLIDKDFETAMRKFVTKRFYNRIDATDEQRQKLDGLFSNAQEESRPMREQFRRGLLDVSALMSSDEATDDQIMAKVKEVREVRQKIQDQRINTALQVRKVLTHAQRQQVHDRITEIITGGVKPRRLGMLMNLGQ